MKGFKLLLDKLDATLRNYNPVEYQKLQAPLPSPEIDKLFKDIGFEGESLRDLFKWKNGEKDGSNCQMMIHGGLQSLKSIKAHRDAYDVCDPNLVEIISDNGEESLLFNTKEGRHYGKLYLYSIPQLYIEYPISYFDSLEAMVQTVIKSYESKAFIHIPISQQLRIDFNLYTEIAKKINKKCAYWNKHNPLKEEEWYEI